MSCERAGWARNDAPQLFFVAVLRCSTTTIIIRVLLCDFGFTAGLRLIFSGTDLDEAVLWTGY